MKLRNFLSPDEIDSIEKKIEEIENKTSGEIVPMIVYSSSVRGHMPALTFLILLAVYLTFAAGQMLFHVSLQFVLMQIAAVSVVLISASVLAVRSDFLLRVLTSDEDLADQVERRAELEFWRAGLRKTDGSTGVLLFVSLAEHWAVVLADESISKKLPDTTWNEVAATLISGIKKKDVGQGFRDAIGLCGEILTPHFPIRPQDKNELPNKLVIKD